MGATPAPGPHSRHSSCVLEHHSTPTTRRGRAGAERGETRRPHPAGRSATAFGRRPMCRDGQRSERWSEVRITLTSANQALRRDAMTDSGLNLYHGLLVSRPIYRDGQRIERRPIYRDRGLNVCQPSVCPDRQRIALGSGLTVAYRRGGGTAHTLPARGGVDGGWPDGHQRTKTAGALRSSGQSAAKTAAASAAASVARHSSRGLITCQPRRRAGEQQQRAEIADQCAVGDSSLNRGDTSDPAGERRGER